MTTHADRPTRTSPALRLPRPALDDRARVDPKRVLVDALADHRSRWRPGDRLDRLLERRTRGDPARARATAVDAGGRTLTYARLEARANQLARHLLARGVSGGFRVGLVLDDPVDTYVCMLAVLKVNAAYVPMDPGFPPDRLAYIVDDARVSVVLSMSHLRPVLRDVHALVVCLDAMAPRIVAEADHPVSDGERADPVDELAYVIYTSGSTGRPKGVAVDHPSICNFVQVAAECYGIRPKDRVYQGMTIAFDFSVEEIWVPWMVGATLVPRPPGPSLVGADLHAFLTQRRVTALCAVPTLLATIEEDLPELRFLLVSGEACPQDLIGRWYRPQRRFLNVYGPTEATVTTTWTSLRPERPVTIGVPLPTYATVILDPDDPERALPHGEVGEIGVAGIGLARGYLNRDDLTARAFVRDFLGIPHNPSARIYRTGDLGRVNGDGEIEYHGRIDLQVKINGYRIELTEIESVLLQVPGVAAAVVDTYEPEPGTVELVGYYSVRHGHEPLDHDEVYRRLRERLPQYMVPAYLEHLAAIPMTTSDKADRRNLPAPTSRRAVTQAPYVAPETETERRLAQLLSATLRMDQVSVTADFFDDLGGSSLSMARFTARVRADVEVRPPSMRDIYRHRTVRDLAAALGDPVDAPERAATPTRTTRSRPSSAAYAACGLAQLAVILAVIAVGSVVFERTMRWIAGGVAWGDVALRGFAVTVGLLVASAVLPIVMKWLLVGRWKPREIRLWSPAYLRFWLARGFVRLSPVTLFVGSPLYSWYLRALGARIGRNVVIFSRSVPVATDLLTIGAGTVIRPDVSFAGYRAVGSVLQIGPVTLGRDVVVGERTVLEIGTVMGDGAQLGHASSLRTGQAIPAGECWHGCPAQPGGADHRLEQARCGLPRKIVYTLLQVAAPLGLGTAAALLVIAAFRLVPALTELIGPSERLLATGSFHLVVPIVAGALFAGGLVLALLVTVTVPRLPNLLLRPGRVYGLFGLHHICLSLVTVLTNSPAFMLLLGDSSFVVGYVRALGYDLSRVEQTGSNFGTEMRHDSPYLTRVGTGTMISDGLTVMNADFSATSFRVSPVSIGARNFIGNNVAFPAGARTGDNCLLATKVMVPTDGPVRENVGLLGSPPFEIPRSTRRENPVARLDDAERRRLLRAKNRHNAATILTVLLLRAVQLYVALLLVALAIDLYSRFGTAVIPVTVIALTVFWTLYAVLLERATLGFRRLRPRECSIYDRAFWRHERLWKFYLTPPLPGTPFNPMIWRLAGVRMGRRVFDDGCVIPEKSLVTVGDDVALNAVSVIQCHSLEDGLFTSDRTTVGNRCTVGVGGFVHYGVTMADDSELEADSLLMKGEQTAPGSRWVGNPAVPAEAAP